MMMSDGALSQAEIDALLAGVDSSGSGAAAAAAASGGFSETERAVLEAFLASTTEAQSSNLSMMTGSTVSLKGPQITINGRDNFLAQLSETVTVVKADFSSGFPGPHMFIMSEDGARAIASLMTKEDNIQLDEMAMSVIGEVVSQIVGHQITALTDKTGNKSISSISPETSNVPKTVVALPAGDFAGATYQLDLGGGNTFEIWEVLGPSVASDIARTLSGQGGKHAAGGGASGGMNMGGMQMGSPNSGGMPFGSTNVQSVQFPCPTVHHRNRAISA